ncbi:MAG: cysteine hydrolase family protein [Aquabacterium sp.]
MKTCLLVIDVQQSFLHRPYFNGDGLPAFLQAQNALVAGAQARGWPVVRVLHHEPDAAGSDPFARASGLVRAMDGLSDFDADLEVFKTRHSALVGTGLDVWLLQQGVRRLVISGIRTEQCCETTARHASDMGYEVVFVPEATLTWDIALPGGGVLPVAAIRERTAAVLDGRFAEMRTVQALQAEVS